jgi:F-type H+-transporting ATPase subunit a
MSALLLCLLLQATPAGGSAATHATPPAEAQATPQAPPETPAAEARAPEAGAHGASEASGEIAAEEGAAEVILHHATDGPFLGFRSKHFVFLLLAALVVILGARLAVRSYRGGVVPRGIGAAVEGLVVFVRDQIAEPNIGHADAPKFTPLLCSFFFFILVAALLGLLPLSATSTGNLAVTMGLALISFAAQQYAGISKYGLVGHFQNLIPPGLPVWLLPIMIPVEILSMFTKPFALMVRLFANMLAGHMVITTLLLLIPLLGQTSFLGGALMAPVSIALALFIMLLEVLVAFIQAYIFTLLSAIFIGMYAHPAH